MTTKKTEEKHATLDEAIEAGATYGAIQAQFGVTSREAHVRAFVLGRIDPKTPMGAYWGKCVDRYREEGKLPELVAAPNGTKKPAPRKRTTKKTAAG